MNILTIADGFGDSVAVPPWYPDYIKWPEIIKLMTKKVNLINLSRFGVGNEFIVNCLKHHVDQQDYVLIQWAMPNRLDLLLNHNNHYTKFWQDTIESDPIYHNNTINLGNNKFWISSASTTRPVAKYHQKYISHAQHQLRSQIYINYAKLMLENLQIKYQFMLTSDSDYLNGTVDPGIYWSWHSPWQGMDSFRFHSEYKELDFGLAQPIPLVHFDFIKKFIMPKVDLPWRSQTEINAVENMLLRKYQEALPNKPNNII